MRKFILGGLVVIGVLSFSACKKDVKNQGIVGRWKLVKVVEFPGNTVNSFWNSVSDDNAQIIEFTEDGSYSSNDGKNGNYLECTGVYTFQSGNQYELNTNCNLRTLVLTVDELTPTRLIISSTGREGPIKRLYRSVK